MAEQRLIDANALVFNYSGLAYIYPDDFRGIANYFAEQVKAMPTVDLPTIKQEWIPCSERLPDENTPVLLGVRFKDDFKYFVTARMDYNYWTGLGREIRGEMRWCELPEPWKGEENG